MMTTDDRDQAVNADEYNGWSNRETWAASLHLSNDFGLYQMVNGWANDARAEAAAEAERDEFGLYADGTFSVERSTLTNFMDKIESYISSLREDMFQAIADPGQMPSEAEVMMVLEIGSEWRVNWRELAENWLEGFEFEEDDQ